MTELIARGNTADILDYGSGLVCKLFHLGYPQIYVEHEFENARLVSGLGLCTPKAYEMVRVGERDGIVYNRVMGTELASKLYGPQAEEQNEWLEAFADFHKRLLSCRPKAGMNYKDFLRLFADGSGTLLEKIQHLKDGDSLLHGDYHPGNLMVDAKGNLVLIDLMNVCRGPAEYDVARTCFLLREHEYQQQKYLAYMGYPWKEIQPYYEVIALVRENEEKLSP